MLPPTVSPTAKQLAELTHFTPFKKKSSGPGGLKVGWIAHVAPLHRSARLLGNPALSPSPTAVQARPVVHETASRVLDLVLTGLAVA
jgi:hypothetical protein